VGEHGTNHIVVDPQAALDFPSRTLTLTLSSLDPQQTSAVFQGSPGVTYRCISVARDHAGKRKHRPGVRAALHRVLPDVAGMSGATR